MTFQRRVFGPGDKRASIGRNKTCRLGGQASPPPSTFTLFTYWRKSGLPDV